MRKDFFNKPAEPPEIDGKNLAFFSPDYEKFELEGYPWRKPGELFRRLPEVAPNGASFPENVDTLALLSAGGALRFRTDSSRIAVRAKIGFARRMSRMPLSSIMGFDLYSGTKSNSEFCGVTRFEHGKSEYCVEIFNAIDENRIMRDFTINFPLFAEIKSIEIGLSEDAKTEPPRPRNIPLRVMAYGTSILHGAAAGRPGLAWPAIVSRRLDIPVINLGFCGNACGEPELAETIASAGTASAFIVDYDANVSPERLRKTLPQFIRILRSTRPEVPVLHISITPMGRDYQKPRAPNPSVNCSEYAAIHEETQEILSASDPDGITFLNGSCFFGEYGLDCLADGIHPNDIGMMRIADAVIPALCGLLNS